MVAKPKKLS